MSANGNPLTNRHDVLDLFRTRVDCARAGADDDDRQPLGAPVQQWPRPLSDAAFIGIGGDAVRMIEPETESDPAALLVQFLAFYGAVAGRCARWQVESTDHHTNLFCAIVGDTSVGRKGTGWDRVRACFTGIDPDFDKDHIRSGLISGEGVVWHVRDPIIESVPQKDKGKVAGFEQMETDPGIADKRLLVIESEFARVLASVERQGNTLSPTLRDAWDGKPLATMTKNRPTKCMEPHISVVAHITADELQRMLSDTSVANGFLNRFLLVGSRRSKILPFGGRPLDFGDIRLRLHLALEFARGADQVELHEEARPLWVDAYTRMTCGGAGMFGAVVARGPAHVMRLAMLYSLLDQTDVIRHRHLAAALEVWRYCSETAAFLFGDSLGDPLADQILAELRAASGGLTRTAIFRDVFQKHKTAAAISVALSRLAKLGKIRSEVTEGAGRPVERWFAV